METKKKKLKKKNTHTLPNLLTQNSIFKNTMIHQLKVKLQKRINYIYI